MKRTLPAFTVLLLLPQAAAAQQVTWVVVALALVPVVNVVLAALFALACLNFMTLVVHVGLALAWFLLFLFTTEYTGSDFLAWLPVGLSVAHSLWLTVFTVHRLARRFRRAP